MKTSTMFIITAILVTLVSLFAFDYSIKKVYLTGEYKSRFNGMDFTPLSEVEKLNIETAKLRGIQIEYGAKEGIWIDRSIKEKIKFDVNQHTLNLGASEASKNDKDLWINGHIVIVTKKLSGVATISDFISSDEAIKKHERFREGSSQIIMEGYNLGQLDLQIASFVSIYLHRMEVQTLNATVGTKIGYGAELTLSSDTKINNATLNVPGNSKLTMLDPKIVKTNYLLSDSATVSLNGRVVQMIK